MHNKGLAFRDLDFGTVDAVDECSWITPFLDAVSCKPWPVPFLLFSTLFAPHFYAFFARHGASRRRPIFLHQQVNDHPFKEAGKRSTSDRREDADHLHPRRVDEKDIDRNRLNWLFHSFPKV